MAKIATPIRKDSGIADLGESLSPEQKKFRTALSFTRKVEFLEAWVEGGVPDGQWWPRSPTEFRQWHQPDTHPGVRAWSSPNIASGSGPYADLRRRFDVAVATLLAQPKATPRSELQRERVARMKAEARVTTLAVQNSSLLSRMRQMENDLEVVKAARDAAQRRVREYEEAFGRIVPKPMSVPDGQL